MKTEVLHRFKKLECFLLDMDGTLYLSDEIIEGVTEFLDILNRKNIKTIFLTNNSSKNAGDYQAKLLRLGIKVDKNNIFTSGEATRVLLHKRLQNKEKKIYLLGNKSLEQEFIDDGYHLTTEGDNPHYVVLGFDTTLTYEKIKTACYYIDRGVPFVATHPDLRCPVKNGYIPDTGSMIKMFEAFTHKSPEIVGKPNVATLEAVVSKYNLNKEKICMVGDRIYTDIKMAVDAHIFSILVLSGETKKSDLSLYTYAPSLIVDSVKNIIDFFKEE